MADRQTETAAVPAGAVDGREDTVAIPRTPAAPPVQPTPATQTANGSQHAAPPRATTPVAPTHTPVAPSRQDRRAAKDAARRAAAPQAVKPRGRKARLRLTRVDPWSVMKTSFLLSIALGIVTVVSVLMVWTVLGAADVWQSVDKTVQDVVGGQDASSFNIEDYIGTRRVVGFTMIVAAVDVVLVTAIATLGAFLYNMSASLLGGIEVTLAEDA